MKKSCHTSHTAHGPAAVSADASNHALERVIWCVYESHIGMSHFVCLWVVSQCHVWMSHYSHYAQLELAAASAHGVYADYGQMGSRYYLDATRTFVDACRYACVCATCVCMQMCCCMCIQTTIVYNEVLDSNTSMLSIAPLLSFFNCTTPVRRPLMWKMFINNRKS